MDRSYKPQGYSSVSAYVVANGAQGVIDFLIKAFDARQTRRYDMPDGSIMHAEVQIDDTVVMVSDGADDNPAFPVWLHVYVPDLDASYRRALDAGGLSVDEPKQREGSRPPRRGERPGRQHLVDRYPGQLRLARKTVCSHECVEGAFSHIQALGSAHFPVR
jgi:predicted enzyme related to lactoylglutathione lyase